jgi:hypothetical protein
MRASSSVSTSPLASASRNASMPASAPACRASRKQSAMVRARRSDIGSHPLDLGRVDAEAPCRGAKAHDTQRYSLWCPRFDPLDSQRRMETYDAARAPGPRRCEEIVFPSSLSDHVIQAAADLLNRSASNQRGQVSRGQSEVPYLVRPKVRWDALYAEPVKSAVAQTMQSVEIELGSSGPVRAAKGEMYQQPPRTATNSESGAVAHPLFSSSCARPAIS